VGSTFINKVGKDPDAALAFLHEGERFNPQSFEVQTELGHVYLVYKRDYARAERHLRKALDLLPRRKLTELEEEARTDAIRWLALNYVEWEKPAEAVRLARYGRELIGPDASLDLVLERKGRK
jgi:tetratricopeptide (TPR) repeat protein